MLKNQNEISVKMEGIQTQVNHLDIKLVEQGKSTDLLHHEINEVKQSQVASRKVEQELRKTLSKQQESIMQMREHANRLERKSREKNLRIVGYPETARENSSNIVKTIIKDKFKMNDIEIENAHRTGKGN